MSVLRLSCGLTFLLMLAGCASTEGAHDPGVDLAPGWERVGGALRDAAAHPGTWAPLAAAAALQVDDADRRISEWAVRETPLFGDPADADRHSDRLRSIARAQWALIVLSSPGPETPDDWLVNKSSLLVGGYLGRELTSAAYGGIKRATNRERPDGSDRESFPSGHAASASYYAGLAELHLDAAGLEGLPRTGVSTLLQATSIGTSWARVEAGVHHPSDVLAGYALGNFMSRFLGTAFFGLASGVSVVVTPDGTTLTFQGRFP